MRVLELERPSPGGLRLRLILESTDVESHDALSRCDAARNLRVIEFGVLTLHYASGLLDQLVREDRDH